MSEPRAFDDQYTLDEKFSRESGRVFITGVQALVRLPLMQRDRDLAAGLNTAGFISGYRGSPLGTLDMALWQARSFLEEKHVRFEPGVNEDLAATAVWGSQQANLLPGPRYDGVFGMWYGKGPGVDRSCDALKHGNYAGSAPHGGVLVLAGDDPGAKSSSIAHQSEHALIHCGIPILNPSNVQDYLDFGLHGWALSRYSGCWVGFKCLTDTVESSGSVSVGPERVQIRIPEDFSMPEGGLNIGWSNLPLAVEHRLFEQRLGAVAAYVRTNALDRVVFPSAHGRLGIVTTGKAYLDVRQALDDLGVDEARASEMGLTIYKVAMTWPLEPEGASRFANGLEEILVVEEKRPILEEQLARLLYNLETRPRLIGKQDEQGRPLVPNVGELSPSAVADVVRTWLSQRIEGFAPREEVTLATPVAGAAGLMRLPSFCSGCPHNTSTVVPEDSLAMGGIGCHGMAVWLPERRTLAVTQMGGEGANWIGQAPFTNTQHIFQNLGDGTYFHSGLLAVRAAVTSGANITYKILVNGAVAMTGGQPIEGEPMEGEVTTPEIARQLDAEGVVRIAVVSDDIEKYPRDAFPSGVTVHHRDALQQVQRELREVKGTTAIVYDQTCAAEARRLRKRGELPDPELRIVINERVCEGCGDCSVQSNCISIEPVETELGRKRTINQSSCNKDYSCLKGYCPSFVSIVGGKPRKGDVAATDRGGDDVFAGLPEPVQADCARPFNIFVAGIGGTGVITVGALIGMAAHLERKGCSLLDVTGLAQKNGPVSSHIRVAEDPESLFATRIAAGAADLVLGCDIVVTAGADGLGKMSPGRTTAVVNSHVAPTADFANHPDLDLSSASMEAAVRAAAGDGAKVIAATELATALLGDGIASNLFMVGYAMQMGKLPVGLGAMERAIELNGRAVEMNKRALAWGRLAAHDLEAVNKIARPSLRDADAERFAEGWEAIAAHRQALLTEYQNSAYARRYRNLVDRVANAERERCGAGTALAEAVARYYYKLLAYKDEYEVARYYSDGGFRHQLDQEFEPGYQISKIHLAPQFLPRNKETGRPPKVAFGPWILVVLGWMSKLKFLRGTPFDPLMVMQHRRIERRMIGDYEEVVERILQGLGVETHELAVEIASLPEQVRGFDDIKERNLEAVRVKQNELLEAFQLHARLPDPIRS